MNVEANAYSIACRRQRFQRGALRMAGRLVLPLAFRLDIGGKANFPVGGPLIVAGNHVAVMEVGLMAVFTPWPVEMLVSVDVPHERLGELAFRLHGGIPIFRGSISHTALGQAVDVLKQNGIMGIFPEGGTWAIGATRPQTGVAWLSYMAGAPVLPIGFSGTLGALNGAVRFKRPKLIMRVGTTLPPISVQDRRPSKASLQDYATRVMEAVKALIPPDDPIHRPPVVDERFELCHVVRELNGRSVQIPDEIDIIHGPGITTLLHNPVMLKVFRTNLRLPTAPLEHLCKVQDAGQIVVAVESVLRYLRDGNPHFLTYRFGPKQADATHQGLRELLTLARWAAAEGYALELTPIRRYRCPTTGKEVIQTEQAEYKAWR